VWVQPKGLVIWGRPPPVHLGWGCLPPKVMVALCFLVVTVLGPLPVEVSVGGGFRSGFGFKVADCFVF